MNESGVSIFKKKIVRSFIYITHESTFIFHSTLLFIIISLLLISLIQSFTDQIKKWFPFNVIACGGGLCGLAAAIGLKRKGHKVTVLEASTSLNEVGAGIQMPPNSVKILKEYGIFDRFEKYVTIPKNIILRRYNTGVPLLTTPLDQI